MTSCGKFPSLNLINFQQSAESIWEVASLHLKPGRSLECHLRCLSAHFPTLTCPSPEPSPNRIHPSLRAVSLKVSSEGKDKSPFAVCSSSDMETAFFLCLFYNLCLPSSHVPQSPYPFEALPWVSLPGIIISFCPLDSALAMLIMAQGI